jgi:hypothetical protein
MPVSGAESLMGQMSAPSVAYIRDTYVSAGL